MNISARQWLARADRAHRREDSQDFIERAAAGALVEIAETLEEISNALHKAQHATDCWVARAEKAEATIQRVRDVCDLWQRRHDSSIRHPADIPAVAIVAVLRALDGDGDD